MWTPHKYLRFNMYAQPLAPANIQHTTVNQYDSYKTDRVERAYPANISAVIKNFVILIELHSSALQDVSHTAW